MILSGNLILKHIEEGSIVVEPYCPELVSINSIDIRLGDIMYQQDLFVKNEPCVPINPLSGSGDSYKSTIDNYYQKIKPSPVEFETERGTVVYYAFLLEPGRLYLGTTLEKIGTKSRRHLELNKYTHDSADEEVYELIPTMHAKSTAGRLGVTVALCAGMGDIGYCSRWALEMRVTHPIYLPVGSVIGQVVFHKCTSSTEVYNGPDRYQNDDKVRFLPKPLKVIL